MPTGAARLEEISKGEADVLLDDSADLLLKTCNTAGVSARPDRSVVIAGRNTTSEEMIRAAIGSLEASKAVLIVATSKAIPRAVSAVEQLKLSRKLTQLNRVSLQPSLINPGYSPAQSIPNIQAFFGDEEDPGKSKEAATRREINGHKVYDVPCLSIVLFDNSVDIQASKFKGWTVQ